MVACWVLNENNTQRELTHVAHVNLHRGNSDIYFGNEHNHLGKEHNSLTFVKRFFFLLN